MRESEELQAVANQREIGKEWAGPQLGREERVIISGVVTSKLPKSSD